MSTRRGVVVTAIACTLGCGTGSADGGILDGSPDGTRDGPRIVEDATIDAGGGDPLTIFENDLALWLDASSINTIVTDADAGGRVTSWRDRSPYHHDFGVRYVGTGGHIDFVPNASGHAVMRLSGTASDNGAFARQGLSQLTASYLIAVIAAYANVPSVTLEGQAILFRKSLPSGSGQWLLGNSATSSMVWGGKDSPATGLGVWSALDGWNDGGLHVFAMIADGVTNSLSLRVDGVATSQVIIGGGGPGGDPTIGGAPFTPTQGPSGIESPLKGDIAEVIVVDRSDKAGRVPATETEMARLKAYIAGKYGLVL